jgi:hypothetical protein
VCCHIPLKSRTKRLQCCKRVSKKSSLTIIRTRCCRWQRADSRRRMRSTSARTTLLGDIHYIIFDNSRRLAAGESHSRHHRALTRLCIRAPAVSRRSAVATPRVAQKPCSFSSDTRPSTATHRKRSERRALPTGYIEMWGAAFRHGSCFQQPKQKDVSVCFQPAPRASLWHQIARCHTPPSHRAKQRP